MSARIFVSAGRSTARCISVGVVVALALWGAPASALDVAPAHAPDRPVHGGLQVLLTVPSGHVQAGDRRTITATVTNTTGHPLEDVTLLLGLVDLAPGQPVPLGLENWTADPESVALPRLAPGASASGTWHLAMIQPGPLGVYASALAGPGAPITSSAVTVLSVRDVRALNPGHVLPVAIGEPLVLLGILIGAGCVQRARQRRSHRLTSCDGGRSASARANSGSNPAPSDQARRPVSPSRFLHPPAANVPRR